MLQLNNIIDLKRREVKDFFTLFTFNDISSITLNIIVVFEIRTGEVFGIYNAKTINHPDENNSKRLSIKGQDLETFITKYLNVKSVNMSVSIVQDLQKIPMQNFEYSENAFGYVCIGKGTF